ncbi:acyl- thioesterase, putative [Babesia ovis]|uniref:Acyl- thioesterase, putative n=1 Tax=Babesia ovis TaxID=5869 RepID=A0A9W5T8C8_BABOV|nr:acyl- thioesterase, putative [Babesia ovis]
MPRVPPGIRHREVYSELLSDVGLLFERRYKAHQLEDLSQLQHRANRYLARSIANGLVNDRCEVTQNCDESILRQSTLPHATNDEYDFESSPQSVGNDLFEVLEPETNTLDHCGTTVLLSIDDPDKPLGEDIEDNTNVESITTLGNHLQFSSDTGVIEQPTSNPKETVNDVCLDIEGDIVATEKVALTLPNYKRLKTVGLCCLVTHILVAGAFAALLLLHGCLEWQERVGNLHVIYSFIAYFTTRVILQGIFDWEVNKNIRSLLLSIAVGSVVLGLDRTQLFKSIANNVCLVLAVIVAALPAEIVYETEQPKTFSRVYCGIIATLFTFDIIATAYHHYMIIRRMKKSTGKEAK